MNFATSIAASSLAFAISLLVQGKAQAISVIDCNLPTTTGTVHFDLVAGNGCINLQASPYRFDREFNDNLRSPNPWKWQTLFKNQSQNTFTFVGSVGVSYFETIIREITLPPQGVFAITQNVEDSPPRNR